MEHMVIGAYERPPPPVTDLSVYVKIPPDHTAEQEITPGSVEVMTTSSNYVSKRVQLDPVYVTEDTNELVYNSGLMEKGKKYGIFWDGERFMLIRNDDGVSVYVFEADGG